MSNILDKDKFVDWAEKRMEVLNSEIIRDFGGGMTDRLGRYNELKMIKEAVERGVWDTRVWGDDE